LFESESKALWNVDIGRLGRNPTSLDLLIDVLTTEGNM